MAAAPPKNVSSNAPIFRVTRTFCLEDIDVKYAVDGTRISEKFFCHKDPQQPLFKLVINVLGVFLSPVTRKTQFLSRIFLVFDHNGNKIAESKEGAHSIEKGEGRGVEELKRYLGYGSTTWRLFLELEYRGLEEPAKDHSAPKKCSCNCKMQLQNDFIQLLETGHQADVTFDVQGVKIGAHKIILTTRCEYFRLMFESGMAESASNEVLVPDIEPSVFKELLRFVYSDEAPKFDSESTMALLAAADKYDMAGLKEICETALCSNLTAQNVIEALLLAEMHRCDDLMTRAKAVFGSCVSVLKNQENWKKLEESPSLLLQLLERAYD